MCGFSDACPFAGLFGSGYDRLGAWFVAGSVEEELVVYLSWYNGNFDVPLYLDDLVVEG